MYHLLFFFFIWSVLKKDTIETWNLLSFVSARINLFSYVEEIYKSFGLWLYSGYVVLWSLFTSLYFTLLLSSSSASQHSHFKLSIECSIDSIRLYLFLSFFNIINAFSDTLKIILKTFFFVCVIWMKKKTLDDGLFKMISISLFCFIRVHIKSNRMQLFQIQLIGITKAKTTNASFASQHNNNNTEKKKQFSNYSECQIIKFILSIFDTVIFMIRLTVTQHTHTHLPCFRSMSELRKKK